MKIFSSLYNKMIRWSAHRHAPRILAAVSFAESSFFPIPPDVMLISMGLAKPENSWRYAFITTLFSVLGGIFGYLIGVFAISFLHPWLIQSEWAGAYNQVVQWFNKYDVWLIFVAGFSPIPYKIFTVAAGALHMAFIPFVLISWIGRGLRFYLVAACMYYFGEKLHTQIQLYIDRAAWIMLGLIALIVILFNWIL